MKPTIPFSEFSKLDILIGTIKKAKSLEGTNNLVVLEVDLGEAGTRNLIAGLAKTYQTVELIGKQIAVLVNLEPKEIRGIKSEGMLLTAEIGGRPVLLTTEKKVPPGIRVR